MKNKNYSPYATNKGGRIESPRNISVGDPKSSVTKGDDLRVNKANKSK